MCSSKNNLNHLLICTKHIKVSLFSACALISSADIQPYTETPSDQQFGIKTESAQYATDSQPTIVYTVSTIFGCTPVAISTLSTDISVCVDKISSWMSSNRLQLNAHKTEVIRRSAHRQLQLPRCPISVTGASIEPVNAVRDRVFIDNSAATHDRIIEEPCHVALQQLRHLRHYVTSDCFRCSLVVSFVHSSLD